MANSGNQTQEALIRTHLEYGGRISQLEALNLFKCLRLASRICNLRREGLPVQSRSIKLKNGKRVSEYYLLNQHKKTQTNDTSKN